MTNIRHLTFKRSSVLAITIFMGVFILTQYLAFLNYRITRQEEFRKINQELSSVKLRLQRTLTQGLSATRTVAFIIENYGVPKDFDSLARNIIESYPNIDALQLTPGGIITSIYPMEGNEAALGHNVLQDPKRNKEAFKAIETRSMFFAGPFNLKQGGIAVVGRQPVFKDNKFWGFSSVVMRLETLMRASGIDVTPDGDFSYQLSKIDPLSGEKQFFLPRNYGDDQGETVSVEVPDGEWKLYVHSQDSRGIYTHALLLSAIGLVLSTMSGLFGWQLARQPVKLKQMVKERTSQLINVESKYRETLERVSDAVMSLDRDWKYTFVNGKASELLELSSEQCIGKVVWDEFPDLRTEPFYSACHHAINDQKYVSIESFLPKQQGWFKIDIYPSPNGLSLFFNDVTAWRHAVESLKDSEKYFRALIEKSSDAIVLINNHGHVVYQSPSTEQISGYTISEFQELDGIDLIHPEDQKQAQQLFLTVLATPGASIPVSHRLRHKKGHYLWIKGRYTNLLSDESVNAIVLNYKDDTSRVLAEQKVITANRLYQFISKVNQTIVHVTDENRLFSEICTIAVEIGKFRMAWIGMIDESGERVIRSTHAGHEAGYLNDSEVISLRSESADRSPTSRALRTGCVVICNDIETDLTMTRWKELALERGYRATIALPFKTFGKTVGVMSLYATKKDFFDEAEVALLKETIADLSFSLENYEREKKTKSAEESALIAYKEKETVLNRISDSVISLDTEWRYTFMNDAALATHSAGREACLGKKLWEVHPDYLGTPFEEKYREAMQTQQHTEIESFYAPLNTWFSVKIYPSGNGITAFFKDVSDRKRYEQELLRSRSMLQAILENTGDRVWSIDKDYRLIFCNTHFKSYVRSISGLEINIGDKIDAYVPGWLKKDLFELCERALRGEQFSVERTRPHDGVEEVIEYFFNPIRERDHEVTGVATFMRNISDRKRAEQEMVAEKNLSAAIINSLPGIFYFFNKDKRFVRWNKNLETVSGYTANEIATLHPLQLFVDDEKELAGLKIKQVFKEGNSEVIAHLLTKTGQRIPHHFNGHLATFNNVSYVVGMGIDITERVEAERQLRERTEEIQKLSLVASKTANLVVITDAHDRIEWVNESFLRLTEYTLDELIGQDPTSMFSGPDPDRISRDRFLRRLREQTPFVEEVLAYSKSGKRYWLKINISPVLNESGIATRFIGVLEDITRQKEYESNIISIAREQKELIENANAIIFGVDRNGYINEWNKHAARTTGYTRNDVLGKKFASVLADPTYSEIINARIRFVLEGNHLTKEEVLIANKHGERTILLLSATPRRSSSGEIQGLIAVGQDITELTEYRSSLEEKVKIRTDELKVALEKEKELSTMKSRFASMVSHEFRTPLATIRLAVNHVKRYRERLSPESMDAKVTTVIQQVDHMAHLLEAVLTLGKTQDVKIQVNRSPVDVVLFCHAMKQQLESVCGRSHLIHCTISLQRIIFMTDEDLLRNILVNLLGNAIKFSPEKSAVYLDVSGEGEHVVFKVRDEGIGIAVNELDRIFEPFDRGSNVKAIPGTGLGLSIVKKAVDLLMGEISINSNPGAGSVFTVKLPR